MGLRILIVSDHYPPFIGGAHRQTQLLSRELQRRGHEVRVATVWHGGLREEENEGGVTVYRLKQLRTSLPWLVRNKQQRHQPPFPDPISVRQLRHLINRFQPDIVHSYGWISYSCAAALLGKNIPLLISARDYGYGCPTRTLVFRNQEPCSGPELQKCMQCASHLFGTSRGWVAVAGVALGRLLLRRKIHGIHSISTYVEEMVCRDFLDRTTQVLDQEHGEIPRVIIPSFRENDEEQQVSEDVSIQKYVQQLPQEPFILFVGALRRVKGLHQLLTAYERTGTQTPLVLIGTVEFDTPHAFPSGVTVLQNFPHRAVMAAWERSLFGVVPSLWPEPLGSVVYEGMSKGKAVIGTTPGGHTDMIIHEESGLLVPLGDIDELTNAMNSLITDPSLRERLGRTAKERAKQFTADVAVPHFEQFYWYLVNKAAGHAHKNNSVSLGQN